MEELLYMLLRGIMIGVVVSAPMGPVGIFCIQRTLDKGRLSGFYTGVGAAVSDLIYCLLTGFGLSFIEEFIDNHRSPIQLIGSVVLIFFGIWLIRKKPDSSLVADTDHDSPSREGDILKGFALTFSNPLILFLIIGLFAQFNFVIEGIKFYHYILGFIGIIAGALGWWWLVTYFVDKLRGHFNQRSMKRINVGIGIIILIFAAVGIVSSAATLVAAPISPRQGIFESATMSFRVSDRSMKGWHVDIPSSDGKKISIEVMPVSENDPFGDSSVDALSVKVVEYPSREVLGSVSVSEGLDPYRGRNAWRISCIGGHWSVFAGNREYRHLISFDSDLRCCDAPDIVPSVPDGIEVTECGFNTSFSEESGVSESDIFLALQECQEKPLALPGVYSLLDYEHDDSYARLGGQYRVALLPDSVSGHYALYYLAGARANSAYWAPGMKKGRLLPTPFDNIFDVEWRDAEGAWMLNDIQAEFDPLAHTVTVKFPYQNSSLRFRRE